MPGPKREAHGAKGRGKSVFGILTAEKRSLRQAHCLKRLDLFSELVMGVLWVCFGRIIQ